MLPASAESTTVGNSAIQLAALDGDDTDAVGVSAGVAAKWGQRFGGKILGDMKAMELQK